MVCDEIWIMLCGMTPNTPDRIILHAIKLFLLRLSESPLFRVFPFRFLAGIETGCSVALTRNAWSAFSSFFSSSTHGVARQSS